LLKKRWFRVAETVIVTGIVVAYLLSKFDLWKKGAKITGCSLP
jgi:hypothetical protein